MHCLGNTTTRVVAMDGVQMPPPPSKAVFGDIMLFLAAYALFVDAIGPYYLDHAKLVAKRRFVRQHMNVLRMLCCETVYDKTGDNAYHDAYITACVARATSYLDEHKTDPVMPLVAHCIQNVTAAYAS